MFELLSDFNIHRPEQQNGFLSSTIKGLRMAKPELVCLSGILSLYTESEGV